MKFACILTKKADIQVGDCVHCEATIANNTFVKVYHERQCIGYIPKDILDYDIAQYLRGRWPARVREIHEDNLIVEFIRNITKEGNKK